MESFEQGLTPDQVVAMEQGTFESVDTSKIEVAAAVTNFDLITQKLLESYS